MPVKAVPKGYHTVTPYLIVKGGAQALEFYRRAFGAKVVASMPMPGGKLAHAEIKIGNSHIMLADEFEEQKIYSPLHYGGTPVRVLLYVKNVDTMAAQAVDAGAVLTAAPEDRFYGDRVATVRDPFGHEWYIHTHVRDVSPEEMKAAMQSA
jgi:PhnB protein